MKRSFTDCEGGVLVAASSWQPERPFTPTTEFEPPAHTTTTAAAAAKRQCHAGIGRMAEQEVLAFRQQELAGAAFDAVPGPALSAVAELNLLVQRAAGRDGAAAWSRHMLGLHAFTRRSRLASWLAFAEGMGLEAGVAAAMASGAADSMSSAPLWLQLALIVLAHGLGDSADASLTLYTVALPEPLLAWAARWGVETIGGRMRLLRVEAFAAGSDSAAAPVRTLFLPVSDC